MYPLKNPDEGRAEVSQDDARDIVEAIDCLIALRLDTLLKSPGEKHKTDKSTEEQIELLKRCITDYLLVTDPRAGVFKKP